VKSIPPRKRDQRRTWGGDEEAFLVKLSLTKKFEKAQGVTQKEVQSKKDEGGRSSKHLEKELGRRQTERETK